jgi:hypothetical protein
MHLDGGSYHHLGKKSRNNSIAGVLQKHLRVAFVAKNV